MSLRCLITKDKRMTIGRVLPSILSRTSSQPNPQGIAKDAMSSAMDDVMDGDMKGVGEPTSISTSDNDGGYSEHPAKM